MPGARSRGDAERVALLRWRRADDEHRVAGRSTCVEQAPDDAVGGLAARGRGSSPPARRTRTRRHVGAHEVGALDQHDRAGLPRVVERADRPRRGRGARRTARRGPGAAASSSTRPPGTLPRWSSARRPRRGATAATRVSGVLGSVPSPLAITARRDAGSRELRHRGARPRRRRARRRWSSMTSAIGMYTRPSPAGMPVRVVNTTPAGSRPEVLVDAETLAAGRARSR